MIDLHIHTALSDGICSIEEVIELACKCGLNYISITDHNHALAFENENLSKFNAFKGHILTGCEIATSYEGSIIEILGYGINPTVINSWYRIFYSDDNIKRNETFLFNKLKELCKKEKLRLEDNLSLGPIKKGCSKKVIYKNLIKFKDNMDVFKLDSYNNFFRLMLSNSEHPLFLNEAETYPLLRDVVNLIHSAGGMAFLAHPFEYGFNNTLYTLDKIIKLVSLDGIECYHPSANINDCNSLVDFCRSNALYMSGGSDFHNYNRATRIGLSSESQPVCDKLILSWVSDNMLIK